MYEEYKLYCKIIYFRGHKISFKKDKFVGTENVRLPTLDIIRNLYLRTLSIFCSAELLNSEK